MRRACEVVGSKGVELGQFWSEHRPQAYAGVRCQGFPNFFLTAGPYSGGFNWFAMLEANLAHIMACIDGRARPRRDSRRGDARRARAVHAAHVAARRGHGVQGPLVRHGQQLLRGSPGDASLPLPHTPWWRAIRGRVGAGPRDYRFGATWQHDAHRSLHRSTSGLNAIPTSCCTPFSIATDAQPSPTATRSSCSGRRTSLRTSSGHSRWRRASVSCWPIRRAWK